MVYDKPYQPRMSRPEPVRAKVVVSPAVAKKRIVSYKYFATYIGSQLRLSISPGIGRVEKGVAYQVSEDIYHSLKGLEGWTVKVEEVLG